MNFLVEFFGFLTVCGARVPGSAILQVIRFWHRGACGRSRGVCDCRMVATVKSMGGCIFVDRGGIRFCSDGLWTKL